MISFLDYFVIPSGKKDKFLVLLVDDFGAALHTNEQYTEADRETFLAQCRSLAVHAGEGKYFSMIVTSLERLNDIGPLLNPNASPWYNHYLFQSLKLFTKEESDELLTTIRKKEFRDVIRYISGKHPTLLQIAAYLLYRKQEQEQEPDGNQFSEDFERDTNHIFKTTWSRCNHEEKTLLMLIALLDLEGSLKGKNSDLNFDLKGIGRIFTQQERRLIKLEEEGVIFSQINNEEKFYSFTSPIMKKFVVQEICNTEADEIQRREQVFLHLISHGQLEEMKKAIRWIGKNKDIIIPTILKLIQKFFGP
jgi:hypothetical protein